MVGWGLGDYSRALSDLVRLAALGLVLQEACTRPVAAVVPSRDLWPVCPCLLLGTARRSCEHLSCQFSTECEMWLATHLEWFFLRHLKVKQSTVPLMES